MAVDRTLRPGTVLTPDWTYRSAFTLRIDGTDQSYVDLDDPRRLEFDYVQRMADVVEATAEPGARIRIVHVGGAGMTLPRYVAATRPGSAQVVLEPDTELTAFVREHLPLPSRSGIKVRAVDGRTGVAEMRDGFADLMAVDAFDGAQVPAELTTTEFFADAARVLAGAGLLVINVTDRGALGYARRVAAGFDATFAHVALCAEPATLKGRRFGNILLLGSPVPLPLADLAQRAGSGPYPYRVVSGPRLGQLVAGAQPFTDADRALSPPPPDGAGFFH